MTPTSKNPPALRRSLAWMMCALSMGTAPTIAVAQEEPTAAESESFEAAPVSDVAPTETKTYTYTLRQLGLGYPMTLRGIEGINSVSFDVRADQVVTGARLALEYSYSPALIPDLSQINVLVNDQVALSLPVPKETAGTLQNQVIDIPPHLITEFNLLSLQLIGHYAMECEDPKHTSLWAKINNNSTLSLDARRLVLPNDLAALPLPFFDKRDPRKLTLPFVFTQAPDNTTLEAAGAVSSWFGALASYRGANFPVSFGDLPSEGNAVVFASGRAATDLLGVERIDGPVAAILTNPNDEHGKLLVAAGRDSADIKQAALALAVGNRTLSGQSVTIRDVTELKPRKPYDAPNWLPTDRAVQLGELVERRKLSVAGYDPGVIRIPLRLPPDLFPWRREAPKLQLRYRYTPQPVATNSSMVVSVSDKFLRSIALPSKAQLGDGNPLLSLIESDDTLVQSLDVDLPLQAMGSRPELQFHYMYDYIKQGECRDIIIDNMRSAIEPDSVIDLSSYNHYMAMPNLGAFNDTGFPFTRMADLSETAVVFPNNRGEAEVAAYLTVLGRFGESTGHPATRVTAADPSQVGGLADKDLLVISTAGNQPLMQEWESAMPARLGGSEQRFRLSDLTLRVRDWLTLDPEVDARRSKMEVAFRGDARGAYFTGFESPLRAGRSVVVVGAASPSELSDATEAMIGGPGYEEPIQGSLTVVHGKRISSLIAEDQYYVGELDFWTWLHWTFAKHLWLLAISAGLAILLISALLYAVLRGRAHRRLNSEA